MGQNFLSGGGDQLFLLPPDARDWLPGGHLAWAVLEAAGELDLSPFIAWYRAGGQGRPAYHPRLMTGLVMYCYCKGIRSSRAMEMATWDDVGARVICGNLHPDHATIARFITRHEGPVKGLLVQSLVSCARRGLVSVDVVAGDGTKVKASASMAANATAERLQAQIGELERLLEAEVGSWLAQARAADAAEDALFGGGDDDAPGGSGGPGSLARLTDQIVRRRQAKDRLDAGQARAAQVREDKIAAARRRVARSEQRVAREEAACQARVDDYRRRAAAKAAAGSGKRPDGRAPSSPLEDRHVRRARESAGRLRQALADAAALPAAGGNGPPPRVNTTDPASRVMPAKNGGFGQMHNLQALAGQHQVILGIGTHPSPDDTGALHPLLAAARANLDAAGITSPIGKALFDAGYASDANFTAGCEPELYVAVTRESRQAGRLRDGKQPKTMKQTWRQMAARLETPEGKALCKQRSGMIEPVFAQLFARLGRDLHYRDAKVDLELHLWAASHNLLKAIQSRRRNTARPVPATAT